MRKQKGREFNARGLSVFSFTAFRESLHNFHPGFSTVIQTHFATVTIMALRVMFSAVVVKISKSLARFISLY